jgi:hypothetical protein
MSWWGSESSGFDPASLQRDLETSSRIAKLESQMFRLVNALASGVSGRDLGKVLQDEIVSMNGKHYRNIPGIGMVEDQ